MSLAITQSYLERYAKINRELNDYAASLLNQQRDDAERLLREQPIPATFTEHYKRFDIDSYLGGERRLTQRPTQENFDPDKAFKGLLKYGEKANAYMVDDAFYTAEDNTYAEQPSTQPFIGSFFAFQEIYPEVAERYYNKMSSVREDPLSALNTLLVREVGVIYLPAGVQATETINILNVNTLSCNTIAFPRYLVIAEEGSSASLMMVDKEDAKSTGIANDCAAVKNSVIEIYVGQGAHVQYYDVEESDFGSVRIHNVHVEIEAHGNCTVVDALMRNGATRNNYHVDLVGEHAQLNLDGLCILDSQRIGDTWSVIRHSVPNCHSDELFKYAVDDKARGAFSGLIFVAPDAQKTLAYQNNRNLLLSHEAKMHAKPQLLIYADDVKCSHGMTTGQLDEDALFYMMQRGFSQHEAELMLTIAFINDVLEKVELPKLRQELESVIEARFREN